MHRKKPEKNNSSDYKIFNFSTPQIASSREYDYLFKFQVIGDSGVGKSCLILRFTENTFTHDYISTLGIDFRIRKIDYQDRTLRLHVWDSVGQERFRAIRNENYRGLHGIALTYDISDPESFHNIQVWKNEVEKYGNEYNRLILVGTKADLNDTERKVSYEEGLELAQKLGIPFIEVSAKTGANVDEAFFMLASEVLKQNVKDEEKHLKEYIGKIKNNIELLADRIGIKKTTTLSEKIDALFIDRQKRTEQKDEQLNLYTSFDKDILELGKAGLLSHKNLRSFIQKIYQSQCDIIIESQQKIFTSPFYNLQGKEEAKRKLHNLRRDIEFLKQSIGKNEKTLAGFLMPQNENVISLNKILDSINLALLQFPEIKKEEKSFQPIKVPPIKPETPELKLVIEKKEEKPFEPMNKIFVPPEFLCLISGKEMKEPIITPSGHTFDLNSLTKFLDEGGTQEKLREQLSDPTIILFLQNNLRLLPVNYALKNLIENYHKTKEINIEYFNCPILLDIMCDPVVASSGHTFERTAILQWDKSCPLTRKELKRGEDQKPNIIENLIFKKIIKKYTLTADIIKKIILKNDSKQLNSYIKDDYPQFIRILKWNVSGISFIQVAAQNGMFELTKLFIDQALKSQEGKQILKEQLLKKDESGRSIIHWVALVNKDEVAPCLNEILNAADQLGILEHLIDSKETEKEFTPLMLAANLGAFRNIITLLDHKANPKEKTKEGRTAYEIALRKDPTNSIPILKYFVFNTSCFSSSFKQKFGDIEKIIPDIKKEELETVISQLIEIEMDASISKPIAQLSALKKINKYILSAKNAEEEKLFLLTNKFINFSQAIEAYKMNKEDKDDKLINKIFEKVIKINTEYKLSTQDCERLTRGLFLLQFNYYECQKLALLQFNSLKEVPCNLIIELLHEVNKELLDTYGKFKLMQKILLESGKSFLSELKPAGFFEKEKNVSRELLITFINNIECATSTESLEMTLLMIPSHDEVLRSFKESAWALYKEFGAVAKSKCSATH